MTGVAGCCARIESGATTMAVPIKLIKQAPNHDRSDHVISDFGSARLAIIAAEMMVVKGW